MDEIVTRMSGEVWFCVSAMLLLGTCRARLVAEKNILKVMSPDSLKGAYDCGTGKIGIPLYGGTMAGILAYPTSNRNACKSFEEFYISFKAKPGGLPTFLLVDSGDCYFTTKAWNAQNAGAVAIIVVDDNENNFTMNMPKENSGWHDYSRNVSIPSAFIKQSLGDSLKKAIDNGEMVNLNINWRESFPHTYDRVEYEFWTNSNDECGPRCDRQINFIRTFKGAAQLLEKKGYTRFIPHYITWYCLLISSKQCKSECINHGRYCSPDPEHDFSIGYDGRDVVIQNLRQVCLFKVANESGKPWLWWDYASDFALRCPMKDMKYTEECAEEVISSLGVDLKKINDCIGDPEADEDNPVLKAEQNAQNGKGSREHVSILATLVINNRLYRGKLDKGAVLNAICSEFEETTEPTICLTEDIETNECLENNGGCWLDRVTNITACKDTVRGRLCKCPTVNGVKFVGDGYKYCEASGPRRCEINNGGCWKENRDGLTFSACSGHEANGCKCPPGFKGDGVHVCEDVDECKEMNGCQCRNCKCKNTWGSYECSCRGDLLYMREHDLCISKRASTEITWMFLLAILLALAVAGVVGYALYIYWIRRHWRSEIRSFMVQYMPLENQWRSPDDTADI